MADRPFAIVTDTSSGIGYELAHTAAENGHGRLEGLTSADKKSQADMVMQRQAERCPHVDH